MPDMHESDLYRVIVAIRQLFHELGSLGSELHQAQGVTSSMRAVMEALAKDGPRTVPRIARSKSVTRQHIQTIVNELVENGLMETADNPDHKRSPLIRLTAKGQGSFADIQRREAELLPHLAAAVSKTALKTTAGTLAKLQETLKSESFRTVVESTSGKGECDG
jgi:DNA-binding MarR family transcriptional regulator